MGRKAIFKKGRKRIEALQQSEFNLFRIDADTPALREAVQVQLDKLSELFPEFNFSAIYGEK